jgi:DNA polymerase-3 subunit alpha
MSSMPFVHLHCHSHYSLLDGAGRIGRLLERAKTLGMNALALTDHGNLHGALEFYLKAKELELKPIVGYEAYVAPQSRFHKEASGMKEASYHLTLLAQNRTGFKNLLKLASAAYLEGFYFRPRIDKQLLAELHEGLICLSGCVSSELNRALVSSSGPDMQRAMEVAEWYRGVFGDRYFIEIQYNGLEIQRVAMEHAVEVSRRMGIPLVATSDVHYVEQKDAEAQDILLCINTGKFRTDANRMRMETNEFYLRGPDEMYAAFPDFPEAVARSQEIADQVDIELEIKKRHFPVFTPPDNKPSEDYLRELCLEGLKRQYAHEPDRYHDGQLSTAVMNRLDRELGVINKLGFANYFLIVWDFVHFARGQGIEATARGSGVGSIVAFALHLSRVCPLRYDLLFERFLDINRREAPDIDIDFCQQRRGEVIQYVKRRYGMDNVAQIGTFGTLGARAALRDVGRALGLPIPRVDAVTALVPDELHISIPGALEKSDDLKKLYDTDPEIRELLDLAKSVEGLARNIGTHAAAVVIADRPLTDYVPLQHIQGKEEVITQWAMGDVERAGLLKMDFLGLRNLTILSKVVALIEQTTGKKIDPYRFPIDDQETFALLCRGETKGIFQLESGGIRDLLQRMKPDHFRDVIATNALYRPGPLEGGMVDDYIEVKHGRKQPEYKHPVMEEILAETNGVMVYQEQVMRILNRLGEIELASAYTCIKAISKKKLAIIAEFRERFIAGAEAKGLTKQDGEELFALIEKFAGYGFNKSHSTAYALIAYITAYLKAHYPVEFMAALLTSDMVNRNFKKKDSLVEHLEDCQRMNVAVLPPDVSRSEAEFAVADGKILFGLAAIKGCGEAAAAAIAEERRKGGPYRNLFDFCERLDPGSITRGAVESLIKAGAMDSFGARRAQLFMAIDRAFQSGAAAAVDRRSGQKGLFDDAEDEKEAAAPVTLPDVPEWEERDRLAKEKEVLGFYLTSHPLAEFLPTLRTFRTHTTVEAAALQHRQESLLGGMLAAIKFSNTKNPRPGSPSRYAMFDLEDETGMMRCILWPDQFVTYGELVQPDAVLAVQGVIDKRPGSEEANFIVNELIPLNELVGRCTRGVSLRVFEEKHGQRGLEQLHEILRGYPGSCEIQLLICLADGSRVPCKCEGLRVAVNPEMRRRVEELLGVENFHLLASTRGVGARNGNGSSRNGNGRPRGQPVRS